MSATTAAVAVLGALSLVNLVLCIGIVRRLREHTAILDARLGDGGGGSVVMHAAGETVGEFAAPTVDGTGVSRATLTGLTAVGVFSPGCGPCQERMPEFIELAAGRDRGQVIAVVVGAAEDSTDYLARLAPVAQVVREDSGGPVARALGVTGFPSFALIDADGLVLASGTKLGALAMPAPT